MDFSDITAIICEFNPFHHGHEYLISKAKEKHGAVVCIMSGNFVQRGECAFADKYFRAEAAVKCGADLVLSLPFPYSVMSARDFAAAAIHIVGRLGFSNLTFGAESDRNTLCSLAGAVCTEDAGNFIFEKIKQEKNASYPVLRQRYAETVCGKEAAAALSLPNNILAVEYISAIKKSGYDILPEPVKREPGFLSSSQIREKSDPFSYLPEESSKVLKRAPLFDNKTFSAFALAYLRNAELSKKYYGSSGGLDDRIVKISKNCDTLKELYDKCVSPSVTRSSCRRAVLSIIFGIPDDAGKLPLYTQLLCADGKGTQILSSLKKKTDFPIVTKPSAFYDKDSATSFASEIRAENVISVFYDKPLPHPLTRTPVILQ